MDGGRLHDDEVPVDDALVRALLAAQHRAWTDLPLRRCPSSGTDHAVFRLGEELVIRLPRIGWAEQQVEREARWLPAIAPHLPVAVPEPVATGEPGAGYPFRWLVSRWVPGVDLLQATADGTAPPPDDLAIALAEMVRAIRSIPVEPGPPARKRGRSLAPHDAVVRTGLRALDGEIDVDRALALWTDALDADPWPDRPVWVHGDLLPGNVIVDHGRITAVIDWSPTGLGDPACDAMIAWTLPPAARDRFRTAAGIDDDTWRRARGWVLEQTAAFIPYYEGRLPSAVAAARARLTAVLGD